MATFSKFNITCQDLVKGAIALSTTVTGFKVMLTNTLPTATMVTSTDITEISTANGGYPAGGQAITVTSAVQTSGAFRLLANALVFTATSNTIGPFQYAVLHDYDRTYKFNACGRFWWRQHRAIDRLV